MRDPSFNPRARLCSKLRNLRRLDRAAVTTLNRCYGSAQLQLGNLGTLRWRPSDATWVGALRCNLRAGAARMVIEFSAAPFLEAYGGGDALAQDALVFALNGELDPLFEALERIFGVTLELESATLDPSSLPLEPESATKLEFDMLDESGRRVWRGGIAASRALLAQASFTRAARGPSHESLTRCSAVLRMLIGTLVLPVRELSTLKVGSWMRLPCMQITTLWLSHPESRRKWRAQHLHQHRWQIASANPPNLMDTADFISSRWRSPMDEQTDGTDVDDAAPDPLNWISTTVDFEVGQLVVPVTELSHVGAGYVFDLQRSLEDSPVRLLVNGQQIARGELVSIGESLGVSVTHVGADHERNRGN